MTYRADLCNTVGTDDPKHGFFLENSKYRKKHWSRSGQGSELYPQLDMQGTGLLLTGRKGSVRNLHDEAE